MKPDLTGRLLIIAIVLVSLGITLNTSSYQHNTGWCQGLLGGGFPVAWVCDTMGGSPISSWGQIDSTDFEIANGISVAGIIVDVALYSLALWLILKLATVAVKLIRHRTSTA